MITIFLGRELRARFPGDPVSEDGLLALEFTGLVIGVHPVSDLVGLHRAKMFSKNAMVDKCQENLLPYRVLEGQMVLR